MLGDVTGSGEADGGDGLGHVHRWVLSPWAVRPEPRTGVSGVREGHRARCRPPDCPRLPLGTRGGRVRAAPARPWTWGRSPRCGWSGGRHVCASQCPQFWWPCCSLPWWALSRPDLPHPQHGGLCHGQAPCQLRERHQPMKAVPEPQCQPPSWRALRSSPVSQALRDNSVAPSQAPQWPHSLSPPACSSLCSQSRKMARPAPPASSGALSGTCLPSPCSPYPAAWLDPPQGALPDPRGAQASSRG